MKMRHTEVALPLETQHSTNVRDCRRTNRRELFVRGEYFGCAQYLSSAELRSDKPVLSAAEVLPTNEEFTAVRPVHILILNGSDSPVSPKSIRTRFLGEFVEGPTAMT